MNRERDGFKVQGSGFMVLVLSSAFFVLSSAAVAAQSLDALSSSPHWSTTQLSSVVVVADAEVAIRHDMRNPADMLILDRVAKAVFHVPGVAQVQTITRPLGTPIDHSSLAFVVSNQSAAQQQNLTYQRERADDLLKQAGELSKTINILRQQYVLQEQLAAATHSETQSFHDTVDTIRDLRDKIARHDIHFSGTGLDLLDHDEREDV